MVSESKHQRSSRRCVRFAPTAQLCQYQRGPDELTEETSNEIWFQSQDYEEIRENAKAASVDGMANGLDFYISHSYGYTDDKSQEMLNKWSKQSDTLRGLERFVNQEYNDARLRLRNKALKAVIYTQKRLDKEREKSYEKRADLLRSVSTIVSREATEFAFMLGSADQKAAFMLRAQSTDRQSARRKQTRRASNQSTSSTSSDDGESVCSTMPVDSISSHKRTIKAPHIEIRKSSMTYGRKDIKVVGLRSH